VTSKEGLNIDVSIDTVFNLKREQARNIYMNVGSGFENILLKPQIQSLIRDTISGYDTKDLYRDETRGEIRTKLLTEIQKKQEANGIAVTDMLISKIKLPTQLHHSIEEKLKSEQEMQRMNFVIEAARKEAERKAIEAEGIKRFQDIVSKGISQELLKWKAIEVTKDLAASPNTKIIVTGGRDGLPIILNDK
jgi:regulator of protease activity HflC (stomatin/prohibitin superfamily)